MIAGSDCEYNFCSDIEYRSYSVPNIPYEKIDLFNPWTSEKFDHFTYCEKLEAYMKSRLYYFDMASEQWYKWNYRGDGIYNRIDEKVVRAEIRKYTLHWKIADKRSLIEDAYKHVEYGLSSIPEMPVKLGEEDGQTIVISAEEQREPYTCPASDPSYGKLREANVVFAFNNGILNWVTGELLPFTPYLFITDDSRIYCDWNPKANPGKTPEVYKGLFADEKTLNTLFDMMSYCLYRTEYSEVYPYLWLLYGGAGTGKSAIFNVISTLLGANVGTTRAEVLCSRFGPSTLLGKRVNLANEVSRGLLEAQWMKEFVDGCGTNRTFMIERKYRDPYEARLNTTLVFATNNQVSFGSDAGIARRLRVIPMTIRQDDAARIWDGMTSPEGLSWLAWVLFERWVFIESRHGAVEETPEVTKASNEVMRAGSSVREYFYEEYNLEDKEDVVDFVTNHENLKRKPLLYEDFHMYCLRSGRNPISKAEFNLQIQTEYGLKSVRKRGVAFDTKDGVWIWVCP